MSLSAFFEIPNRNTTWRREMVGGITTFLSLSYILFVQPAVLSLCGTGGMDKSAVLFATCFSSAAACIIMGLYANLPIALAPAMGHNFFFAFTVCGTVGMGGFGFTWTEALAANMIAGIVFLLLSWFGLREAILHAIPEGLKYAIAAGIGLLIALVGLEWSGIIVAHPATCVRLGNLSNPVTLLTLFGLLVTGTLLAFHLRGAILLGMCITAAAGYLAGKLWGRHWGYALVSGSAQLEFPNVSATLGKVFGGFSPLFSQSMSRIVLVIFTFLVLDMFDTIGTLIGLGERSGLMQNGRLPRIRQAMTSDAMGTIIGTVTGTSTVTSYVESSAGIAAGARTGVASLVTAILFLLSILVYPLLEVFGREVRLPAASLGGIGDSTVSCYPVVAPVLIIIGCYMLPVIRKIEWEDFSEALPAFLTIVIMQFSMSITDGIAWGFISYAVLKLLTGKIRSCPIIVYICAVLFVVYYALTRG